MHAMRRAERINKTRCPVSKSIDNYHVKASAKRHADMLATSVCETCFLVKQVNSIWWDSEASSNLYPVSTYKRATGVSLAGREWSDIACIVLSRK